MAERYTDVETAQIAPWTGATVRVDGVFDLSAALRLREAIAQLPEADPVMLDFSSTRECHDFALAALVHALATAGRVGIATRGLSGHQHRLLKYLGQANTFT